MHIQLVAVAVQPDTLLLQHLSRSAAPFGGKLDAQEEEEEEARRVCVCVCVLCAYSLCVCVQWTPQVDKQLFYFPPCLCALFALFVAFLVAVVVAAALFVVLFSLCFVAFICACACACMCVYVCLYVHFLFLLSRIFMQSAALTVSLHFLLLPLPLQLLCVAFALYYCGFCALSLTVCVYAYALSSSSCRSIALTLR